MNISDIQQQFENYYCIDDKYIKTLQNNYYLI